MSHADPEVIVILTMWNLEEYWHGEMLDEVLERIAKQETRHVAFYNSQARDRLERSKKAQSRSL